MMKILFKKINKQEIYIVRHFSYVEHIKIVDITIFKSLNLNSEYIHLKISKDKINCVHNDNK